MKKVLLMINRLQVSTSKRKRWCFWGEKNDKKTNGFFTSSLISKTSTLWIVAGFGLVGNQIVIRIVLILSYNK